MEKIIEETNKVKVLYWKTNPKTLKTIYRKLWLCDEFSDSEIVASILSQTDTIPHKS
jgi:hypothetical protein